MDKAQQVADQCKAVAHLATVLAEVHSDYAMMFEGGSAVDLVDQIGDRTAHLMEMMGNILNGMDVATEDDEWMEPVFAEAQRLWPQT